MRYTPDWSELLKGAIAAATAFVAVYNWQSGRRRAKLKDDLDIMKRYREEMAVWPAELTEDPRYECLRAKVRRKMYKTYVLRGTDGSELLTAIGFTVAALLIGFPGPLPFGIPDDWRPTLAFGAAIAAAYFFWEALRGRNEERDKVDADSRSPGHKGPRSAQ